MTDRNVIGTFSEEDACKLSGASRSQLLHWHKTGLLKASFGPGGVAGPYQRIYSFKDLVSLRVLNALRNEHRVSLQHLRRVSEKLSHMGEDRWSALTLYVLGRKVVFDDPNDGKRKEAVSGQRVFEIPLRAAISDTMAAIKDHNRRRSGELGKVVSQRFLQSSEPVFAKSRIPVSAVRHYLERGYSKDLILEEFPDLTGEDIQAVQDKMPSNHAA